MQQIKITKRLAWRALAVAVAAVITVGGTMAIFNDSRTLADNKIKAGKFELSLDNTCHYDGMVCEKNDSGAYVWVEEETGSSEFEELLGEPCECTWTVEEDSEDKLIFNLDDVKPGDNGEKTVSIHIDDNPGWVCADFGTMTSFDNDCTAPEEEDGDGTCGDPGEGEGELQDNILFSVWIDDGNGSEEYACDNILNHGEEYVLEDVAAIGVLPIIDSTTAEEGITDGCVGIEWKVPLDADNTIQTDSLEGDITFTAYQTRHNRDFVCEGTEPETGSIKVTKVANGGDATFGFGGDVNDFTITTSGGAGTKTINNLTPGTYDIDETDLPDGWVIDSNGCQDVVVEAGKTAECTVENTMEEVCIDQADVMLVLDRSGSVAGSMADLKSAAKSFVTALNPDGGVHMGQSSFATDGSLDTQLTNDVTAINSGIDALVSSGWTNLYEGLHYSRLELASVRDRDDGSTPDYMIVITDGNPNRPEPENTADDVALAEANAIKGEGTTIFVVGVGTGINESYLRDIATGDDYYFGIDDYSELDAALLDIATCDIDN